jgi:hypothetical protein
VREQRFGAATRRAQAAAGLLVVGLQQRLLSSIEAFARSLKVHRATVERQWEKGRAATTGAVTPGDLDAQLITTAPDADDERGEWAPETLEAEEVAQIEAVTAIAEAEGPRDVAAEAWWRREQALLDEMQEVAERTRHLPDAKVRRLVDWIREHLCPELPPFGQPPKVPPPRWTDRRVLIFTENREGTKRYLKTILEQAIEGTDRADCARPRVLAQPGQGGQAGQGLGHPHHIRRGLRRQPGAGELLGGQGRRAGALARGVPGGQSVRRPLECGVAVGADPHHYRRRGRTGPP